MRLFWRWFLAWSRLDLTAVCEMSQDQGLFDYHDYRDSTVGEPWHFYPHTCKRCGKQFEI